jgi:hypothetical protein
MYKLEGFDEYLFTLAALLLLRCIEACLPPPLFFYPGTWMERVTTTEYWIHYSPIVIDGIELAAWENQILSGTWSVDLDSSEKKVFDWAVHISH